jgi:hypothetical protein
MKKLNNKQIEAISAASANLGNILFLGIGVGLVAIGGTSQIPARVWIFTLSGWLLFQFASGVVLSYWRNENE